MGTDVLSLRLAEGATSGPLERVDVHFHLAGEKLVDRRSELQELTEGLFSLLGAKVDGDLVDEQAVHTSVARFVDPVEAQYVAEQFVKLAAVADMLDVVELGEPLDHAGQQQSAERRGTKYGPGHGFASGHQIAGDTEPGLDLLAGSAKHLLVLDLFFGEAQQ